MLCRRSRTWRFSAVCGMSARMPRIDELLDYPMQFKQLWAQDRTELIAGRENQLDRVRKRPSRIREEDVEQVEVLRQRMQAEKKAAIKAIMRRNYGPKNERFDSRQLLFL